MKVNKTELNTLKKTIDHLDKMIDQFNKEEDQWDYDERLPFWQHFKVKEPDYFFDFVIHDSVVAEDMGGLEIPLPPERKSKGQISLGCYLFVHGGEIDSNRIFQYTPLYAGKAVRIKNRLRQHWRNPQKWLDEYYTQAEENGCIDICVAVWMMESREEANAFEVRLIETFGPRYNIRKN